MGELLAVTVATWLPALEGVPVDCPDSGERDSQEEGHGGGGTVECIRYLDSDRKLSGGGRRAGY